MVELKQFDNTDFNRLIQWIDSEESLIQFTGPIFKYPLTIKQLEGYIADKNRFAFKVTEINSGEIIGHSEVYDLGNNTSKLCRILLGNKNLRGKGFGQEIVKKLVEFTFEKLGSSQIELNVYDWNISAIKCYEKVGFLTNPEKKEITQLRNNKWTSINMILKKLDWENI
jgi:RimJ/RimL family protein N-acetyltransferase